MVKVDKCKHEHIQVYRTFEIGHVSDMGITVENDETSISVNWQDTSEWNMKKSKNISVTCMDCKQKWHRTKISQFPKLIIEILEQEEWYFDRL